MFSFWSLLVALSMQANAFSAPTYPKDYFSTPLDIPLYLAGNFGELRTNHFHAGLDIKTQGKEGLPVFAAAEGYVSRIKIGLGGYGKALYIDHPNGYTTVYAHLQAYEGAIADYVKKVQFEKESFTLEVFPQPGELPISKRQLVALSGNTGGSGGPHLHFEIRETESEIPVNPLLFGFPIRDNIKPIIRRVALYPLADSSRIGHIATPKFMEVEGTNGRYHLKKDAPVEIKGALGLGLEVIDKMNGTSNRNGVYSIELRCDDRRIYYHEMEKISFAESRYINSHADYREKILRSRWVQKSFLQPNNQLSIYREVAENGRLELNDDQPHQLQYIVKDVYGNTSTLDFKVRQVQKGAHPAAKTPEHLVARFRFDRENLYQGENIKVNLPKGLLYDHLNFEYRQGAPTPNSLGPVHHVHHRTVALQGYLRLALRLPPGSEAQRNKVFIAQLKSDGSFRSAAGGQLEGDYLVTETKYFGRYAILVDSMAPSLVPVNIRQGANLSGQKTIAFEIHDARSGLASFDGYIDGQWVLMEYDRKTRRLQFDFEAHEISSGPHTFELRLTDNCNNERTFRAEFVR
ncbi:MAG: M23 family metallopeptidase [Salibacteraceae bacterium]